MAKDDELLEEKIDDEIDLLNFDLDDLEEEDSAQDITEPTALAEDSGDEIIDLLDIVDKGDVSAQPDDTDISQLLDSDDLGGKSEDTAVQEPTQVTDAAPQLKESQEPTEVDIDISDLELESDLTADDVSAAIEETGEIDVSESDLKEMLEEEPDQAVEDDLAGTLESEETFDDLMKDADLEESFAVEGPEIKVEIGEEEITESDLEKLLEDQPDEGLEVEIEPPSAPIEAPPKVVEEPTVKMEAEPPEEEVAEPADIELEMEKPKKAPKAVPAEKIAPISEERIEAAVVDAVQNTVERVAGETIASVVERVAGETVAEVAERVARETISEVTERVAKEIMTDVTERIARETMANVAEKVITEAIEALKRSIESESD